MEKLLSNLDTVEGIERNESTLGALRQPSGLRLSGRIGTCLLCVGRFEVTGRVSDIIRHLELTFNLVVILVRRIEAEKILQVYEGWNYAV